MLARPSPTIRLRLTAAYGALFLASGAVLLAITYFLLRHDYTGRFFFSSGENAVVRTGTGSGRQHGLTVSRQTIGGANHVALLAANAQSAAALHKLLVDSGIALAIMAVLSIWLGWLIAGRALRPLRTITNAAREISANNLHRRLALDGPEDELKQLGTTFDGLLERLETAFAAQRQFVANASHELRTPLTLERALLELALSDPEADAASLRETCEQVLAVGEEQERLIEALLTLSRSQRGLDRHEPVDLAATTAAAAAAADRDGLAFETSFEPALTTGDPRLLERLAANLIGNAVNHNLPGGSVTIETGRRNGAVVLRVANTGRPIRPEEVPRLFEPFERLEDERVERQGFGLGLSIVDAIARAHGATLTASAPRDGGLDIEVEFPAAARS
ncbi:MAG TPA: ATP-binding protein [Gaiellaceae bacterium]|nr:ATP-binding protein [Gaiellaceae bacterium]HUJ54951.1 ATP-binding protein [Gaiellaceae bacterium]